MDYRERWELKDYLIGRTLERRVAALHVVLILLLVGFVLDFWYLQGVHGKEYGSLAENNRLRRIPLPPLRGVIFDREEQVLAAARPSLDLLLLRESGTPVEAQLRRLEPILDTPYAHLRERTQSRGGRPLYEPLVLKEDVRLPELARIEARRELFPSVEVRQSARRSYPHGDMFGHVLGYVGEVGEERLAEGAGQIQAGDIIGKSGLERAYDDLLRGIRGWNVVSVNSLGRSVAGPWVGREPSHGSVLRLTVDLRLQRALRAALGDEAGAGVFLDPRTGEVLALASSPSFDPNRFADGMSAQAWRGILEDPRRPLHDRVIASYYAPGSVFKVLMAIAGLDTGTVTPGQVVHCSGSTRIYGQKRLCWKRGGHGPVDLRAALTHSCNVYFYHLGKQLGIDEIERYARTFGLGSPSGIDLPGEVGGVLPGRESKRRATGEPWYPGDTISVAIGQGLLAVTPIQVARMMAAVGSGRAIVRPHLVRDAPAQAAGSEGQPLRVAAGTLEVVRAALRDAVEHGTGQRAVVNGVTVAGKTGTAQVFKHSAGIDADELPKQERDHAWFAGYAPADDPRIAFAVVIEHGGHGGTSAAPVVRAVLEVFFSEEFRSPPPDDARRSVVQGGSEVADVGPPAAG
jgi:penicillin-binding protein 2